MPIKIGKVGGDMSGKISGGSIIEGSGNVVNPSDEPSKGQSAETTITIGDVTGSLSGKIAEGDIIEGDRNVVGGGAKVITTGDVSPITYVEHGASQVNIAQSVHGHASASSSLEGTPHEPTHTQLKEAHQPKVQTQKPYILVMKGGGIKGLAYVGAMEVLEQYGYTFNWFVGTSAGSIAAVLRGAGYTTAELKDLLKKTDFTQFLDATFWGALGNLLFHGGLYRADTFVGWLKNRLRDKLDKSDPSMEQLSETNRVTIYACRRGKDALVYDSQGEKKDNSAAFAARCSMSIPFMFVPQYSEGMGVLDGGLRNNYPVGILLQNKPELEDKFVGLYLGTEQEDEVKRQGCLGVFRLIFTIRDAISIFTEARDEENLAKYRDQTIIIDPQPISTLDFSLTEEEKEFLLQAGRSAAYKYLLKQNTSGITADLVKAEEKETVLRRGNVVRERAEKGDMTWPMMIGGGVMLAMLFIVLGFIFYMFG